mmetsp:Transcript_18628/g.34516  ORF Transcript_18628/g.34516 Transcript_18628/m.34516 type:complete len:245 (-) Transcript_18628:117-851(-)
MTTAIRRNVLQTLQKQFLEHGQSPVNVVLPPPSHLFDILRRQIGLFQKMILHLYRTAITTDFQIFVEANSSTAIVNTPTREPTRHIASQTTQEPSRLPTARQTTPSRPSRQNVVYILHPMPHRLGIQKSQYGSDQRKRQYPRASLPVRSVRRPLVRHPPYDIGLVHGIALEHDVLEVDGHLPQHDELSEVDVHVDEVGEGEEGAYLREHGYFVVASRGLRFGTEEGKRHYYRFVVAVVVDFRIL